MTEASGTYTAEWDGKDTYGNFAGANTYMAKIYSTVSSIRHYPQRSFVVNVAVFAISALPDPFVPTGSNEATITVRADALQSGLTTSIAHPEGGTTPRLALREVGSEGTYVATWDGKIDGLIPKDGICTIRVYDSSGNEFPAAGTLTLSSAKSLNVSPNPFEVTGASTATISAEMASGLNLEARIGSVKTIALTESGSAYSASWDGRDDIGNLVPSGTYTVTLWNTDTYTRYDLQTSVAVIIVDTIPPETIITSGPAEGSYVGSGSLTLSWSGSDNMAGPLTYSYRLDGDAWSTFDASANHTFDHMADGSHTFTVKAKDPAGNEDPSPATRNFTVDGTPPAPAANLSATPTTTGVRLEWSHSSSPDIYAYRLYWDRGTGDINYSSPYATIYYPANSFTAGIHTEGTYKFALRAVDKAGNEEANTNLAATVTIYGFEITVELEGATYDRGQDVPVSGTVKTQAGNPITDIPVTIDVESKGFHRYFTAYTNTSGEFRYTFQPRSNEAGTYTIRAKAMHEGLEKSAYANFEILGLYLQPASISLDLSMNSSRSVNLSMKNIGQRALTDLRFELVDNNLDDLITGSVDLSGLPSTIDPGGQIDFSVVISASPGDPPAVPSIFVLNVDTAEGSKEAAVLNVKLHEAVSIPVVAPDPLKVGVRIDEPVTKLITVTNEGFAAMSNTSLRVHDPDSYPWIVVANGDLGTIEPSESKTIQIYVNPPSDISLGTYVVQLDLAYDGIIKPIYLTVEITTATSGKVAFKVYDDTGSVVPGAEVNLISKEFYVSATPQGTQEYNNVINGITDAEGYILFEDVPTGAYRYVIDAQRHDPAKGEIAVEPGDTPQSKEVILVTNLVDVEFSVTPTTIQDQYSVTLNITYATDLTKPTLLAEPTRINLSFFPEETYEGTIKITNTSNNAAVRNLLLNAAELDPVDNEVRIVFDNGAQTVSLDELGPKETVTFA
ncbi:MAG: hypothetical protein DRH15_08370, partial [Deltaproteobacteria bacterium]